MMNEYMSYDEFCVHERMRFLLGFAAYGLSIYFYRSKSGVVINRNRKSLQVSGFTLTPAGSITIRYSVYNLLQKSRLSDLDRADLILIHVNPCIGEVLYTSGVVSMLMSEQYLSHLFRFVSKGFEGFCIAGNQLAGKGHAVFIRDFCGNTFRISCINQDHFIPVSIR